MTTSKSISRIFSLIALLGIALAGCAGPRASAQVETSAPMPAASATPPGRKMTLDPSQVVEKFLTEVQKDYTGSASSSYLSQVLRADVDSGHLLPTILGIQDAYRSFGVSDPQYSPDQRYAIVQATLNYVSPIERDFQLVRENGVWKINAIVAYAVPPMAIVENELPAIRVIFDYSHALETHDVKAAWNLLSADAQVPLTEADIQVDSDSLQAITPTSLNLVTVSPQSLVFAITFWATPAPGEISDWKAGSNLRWMELTQTDSGWRINEISDVPLED
jgi:hypothetical protein